MHPDMLEATRLTRAGRLNEATAALQRLLRGETAQTPRPAPPSATPRGTCRTRIAYHRPGWRRDGGNEPRPPAGRSRRTAGHVDGHRANGLAARARGLRGFVERLKHRGGAGSRRPAAVSRAHARPLPAGAQFLTATYTNHAGSRAYKLYIPSRYRGRPHR